MSAHDVEPSDEQRHAAGEGELWQESWYADFVTDDGTLAGYIRLGLMPNLGVSWWTAMVVTPDGPLTAAVHYELPVPGSGLGIDHDGWALSLDPADPLRRFTVRSSAPAVQHIDPAAVYDGRPGTPTNLDLDLTWTTDGTPYHYVVTTRYEIPCLVEGEITIGGQRHSVRAQGQRDHSWGERDWWALGWCWMSCRLDDGTRVHAVDIRVPEFTAFFGYVQHPTLGSVEPVTSLEVTEDQGAHGLPTAGRVAVEPEGITLAVEPVAFAPLLLVAPDGRISRFPRAYARYRAADGRTGRGWIEWNQPQP